MVKSAILVHTLKLHKTEWSGLWNYTKQSEVAFETAQNRMKYPNETTQNRVKLPLKLHKIEWNGRWNYTKQSEMVVETTHFKAFYVEL
jgi:autotransporter translocation and assembly factor TamB